MAIDLSETILGEILIKVSKINSSEIWFKVFSDVILQTWILDLIRQDQLFSKGIDGNGDIIGYYSIATQNINPSKRVGTPYTLYDTGDFYKSFSIVVFPDMFETNADPVKKEDNLFIKYGDDIIKLTDENMEKLSDEVLRRYSLELSAILSIY
jgi:hypothetical protein